MRSKRILLEHVVVIVHTYMHVQCLSIASASADSRSHDYQLILRNKVPYAALFRRGFVARMCLNLELEGRYERQKEGK